MPTPSEPGASRIAVVRLIFAAALGGIVGASVVVAWGHRPGREAERDSRPIQAPSEWDTWSLVDPRTELPHQPADVAAPKLGRNGHPHPPFITTHLWFLTQTKTARPTVVFFGDSITEGWHKHPALWEKSFGHYQPLNFGIGGDRIQHILWRIQNGELDGVEPKVVVVMAGTNNLLCDSSAEIAAGLGKVIALIRAKSPTAKVLLLGILPVGEKPDSLRTKINDVNELTKKSAVDNHVFFLDMGERFLKSNGNMINGAMPDFMHPSAKGYQIWGEAMVPVLDALTK